MKQKVKNENRVEMRTSEEIVTAFRRRLMKTFSINEEDNGLFCKRTEREVEEWIGGNRERLNPNDNEKCHAECPQQHSPHACGNLQSLLGHGVFPEGMEISQNNYDYEARENT